MSHIPLSPLASHMQDRLMRATRYVTAQELAEGHSTHVIAIEDAAADLVTLGVAEYSASEGGYRYKASELCRDALRALKRGRCQRAVKSQPFGNVCRIGVAEHREGVGIVTYELEIPLPEDGPDFLKDLQKQTQAIINFTLKEGSHA